jgi:hypothetical protein
MFNFNTTFCITKEGLLAPLFFYLNMRFFFHLSYNKFPFRAKLFFSIFS